jgi:hypothetical protein
MTRWNRSPLSLILRVKSVARLKWPAVPGDGCAHVLVPPSPRHRAIAPPSGYPDHVPGGEYRAAWLLIHATGRHAQSPGTQRIPWRLKFRKTDQNLGIISVVPQSGGCGPPGDPRLRTSRLLRRLEAFGSGEHFATDETCHCPPRAVRMPRWSSSLAIETMPMGPPA